MTHPAQELLEDIELRTALSELVEVIRWRASGTNHDGEDLLPQELEAFERADELLHGPKKAE